jgi:hypothetical protein
MLLSIHVPPAAAAPPAEAAGPGLAVHAWNSVTDTTAWQGEGHWRLAFAPAAPHFRPSPEHRHVWAVGVERQRPDDWLAGFAYFSNSFGQPSAYAYVGRRFDGLFGGPPALFGQASAGIIYGYKGQYKNKVALNVAGFAPGALVGVGWQINRQASLAVHLLGDAALMLQLAWDLH